MGQEERFQELVQLATEGRFEWPSELFRLSFHRSIETLREAVLEHAVISLYSPGIKDAGFPNELYWRHQVLRESGRLEEYQRIIVEDARALAVQASASRLAENLEELYKITGPSPQPVAWIKSSLINRSIEVQAADQVAVVGAGVSLVTLQRELAAHGQCLPFLPHPARRSESLQPLHSLGWWSISDRVDTAISLNLPHALEAQCGNWRDWILGMTVMLADGSVVKSGSQAVKNVAGYDAHKLFVGAYGTLGIILEVVLRTFPLDALPAAELEVRAKLPRRHVGSPWTIWIQRTKPSDFRAAVASAGDKALEIDWASSTLWANVPYEESLPRYQGDWVRRTGCREKNLEFTDPTQIRLMRQAKKIFDPKNKLNPGVLGVV